MAQAAASEEEGTSRTWGRKISLIASSYAAKNKQTNLRDTSALPAGQQVVVQRWEPAAQSKTTVTSKLCEWHDQAVSEDVFP